MDVTAYTFFNKRKNSTKRPSGGHKRNVVLLDDVSLYSPIFQSEYWDYNDNYCYWANRYYYVTDVVTLRQNLFEVHCEIDPLATWKADIMATTAFVTFSTSDYDIGIPDYRLSGDPITITKSTSAEVFPGLGEEFVISYVGTDSTPTLGLSYSNLEALQGEMMSNKCVKTITNWATSIIKQSDETVYAGNIVPSLLGSTSNSITRCIFTPKFHSIGTKRIVLAGGYVPTNNVSGDIPSHTYSETYNISIPWAFGAGDFRNRAQFTNMTIYLPGYGFLALNADNYQGQGSISVQATLDSYVGEITYLVGGKAKATCSISYPVQVGTSQVGNVPNAVTGVAQAVSGAMAENPVGTAMGAYNAVRSFMATDASSIGSAGGSSAFNAHTKITLVLMAHNTNVEPSTVAGTIGRPLNAVRQIGKLSGYVQTADVEVPTTAPDEYKTVINDSLNGGMYIE